MTARVARSEPTISLPALCLLSFIWGGCAPASVPDRERHPTPSAVPGLEEVAEIAAGSGFTTALKSDGTVWAWGANDAGQLGDGTKVDRAVPGLVAGLRGIIAISTGRDHSLALKADGTVWSWGSNFYGALGDATTINRATPVQVRALGGVTALSGIARVYAGVSASIAFGTDGGLWVWGKNSSGEYGDGGGTSRFTAIRADSLPRGMTAVALGGHGLGLATDGSVWSWGSNLRGELCRQTEEIARARPVVVPELGEVSSIDVSDHHSLVLKRDGTVWACGKGQEGQLGDAKRKTSAAPVQALGISKVVVVSAGSFYSLALDRDGTVWSWGANAGGQLGDGSLIDRSVPARISDLPPIGMIAAGASHGVALAMNGTVWTWGSLRP